MATADAIARAAEAVAARIGFTPEIGLTLGSGLGGLADAVEDAVAIPYAELPGFPVSTVSGHCGELVAGTLAGRRTLVMRGRAHFYEGHPPEQIVLPLRVMRRLGAHTLILTNASGGLNPDYQAAELMLLSDHINLLALVGHSPLLGPNDDALGQRFPDMTDAYDPALRALLKRVASERGARLHEGVYVQLAGPSFETPAEVRMLRALGADAVGMSTAMETIAARHCGLRVLAVSCVTNVLTGGPSPVGHEAVLDNAAIGGRLLQELLLAALPEIN